MSSLLRTNVRATIRKNNGRGFGINIPSKDKCPKRTTGNHSWNMKAICVYCKTKRG